MIVDLAKRFGGADVRVLELAGGLAERADATVVTLAGSALHERLETVGLPHLPIARRRGDPRIALDLARAARRAGVEVLDGHNPQSQLWALIAGRAARVPTIVATVHSQYLAEHGGSLRGRAYEAVLRLTRRLGGRFVTVSPATEEYVRSLGVPPARVALIGNAVPPARHDPSGRPAVLGDWPTDSFVIGVVARLEPVKGIADLIDALALLAPRHPRLRCLVVGDGRIRSDLEDRVARGSLGERVRFTGFRQDVGRLLSGLDAFCLPSHSEGLPFALLEACSHGLPLVVTAVGGMDVLLEDGVTATKVPPSEPRALATAIDDLVSAPDRAAARAERARRLVSEAFDVDSMVAATLEVYRGGATTARPGTPSP